MTLLKGCDSAMGPSIGSAKAAQADGVKWWEVYVGGPNATHAWDQDEVDVLGELGITPVAIWVPSYGLLEDPVQAAADAVGAMEDRGIFGAMCLDTEYEMRTSPRLHSFVDAFCAHVPGPSVYLGADYLPLGVTPVWVRWGGSELPAAGEGAQYGPTSAYGMSIDRDLADAAFPFSSWSRPAPVAEPPAPLVLQPIPDLEDDDDMKAYVAICSEAATATSDHPAVNKDSVWEVVGLERAWVGQETDVAELLEVYSQAKLRPISGATLARRSVVKVL